MRLLVDVNCLKILKFNCDRSYKLTSLATQTFCRQHCKKITEYFTTVMVPYLNNCNNMRFVFFFISFFFIFCLFFMLASKIVAFYDEKNKPLYGQMSKIFKHFYLVLQNISSHSISKRQMTIKNESNVSNASLVVILSMILSSK